VELDLHFPTCLHGLLRDGFTYVISLRYPSFPIISRSSYILIHVAVVLMFRRRDLHRSSVKYNLLASARLSAC
jgi:hypothetical protein